MCKNIRKKRTCLRHYVHTYPYFTIEHPLLFRLLRCPIVPRMALPTSTSCVFSFTLAILTFAAMMIFKSQLASKEWMTIVGGFLGSQFFIFLITAIGNFEHIAFGKNFQTKLVPEIVFCLMASMFVSGLVHRVCVTTCFIFSCIALYYMVRLSNTKFSPAVKPIQVSGKTKKGQ